MRHLQILAVIVVLGGVGFLGWRWLDQAHVERVALRGLAEADSAAILALSGVEVGTRLVDVSSTVAADRVRRHPWVKAASVSRQPTGTVVISIRERNPVALALDGSGRPAYYLDAEGYRMPVGGRSWDVPIMRGLKEPYHPVTPVQQRSVLEILALLEDLEDERDALLNEIHEKGAGEMELYTALSPAGQSIRVRLGRQDFDRKLDVLQTFWLQAILSNPTKQYEWLDLRFRGQVIARERA